MEQSQLSRRLVRHLASQSIDSSHRRQQTQHLKTSSLLALDPSMKRVSGDNLSASHFGPCRLTGLPALLTNMRSVFGRPRPDFIIILFLLGNDW